MPWCAQFQSAHQRMRLRWRRSSKWVGKWLKLGLYLDFSLFLLNMILFHRCDRLKYADRQYSGGSVKHGGVSPFVKPLLITVLFSVTEVTEALYVNLFRVSTQRCRLFPSSQVCTSAIEQRRDCLWLYCAVCRCSMCLLQGHKFELVCHDELYLKKCILIAPPYRATYQNNPFLAIILSVCLAIQMIRLGVGFKWCILLRHQENAFCWLLPDLHKSDL